MWQEKVYFRSQQGNKLSGLLQYPLSDAKHKVLILGPHPLLGGDINNNVIQAIIKACDKSAAIALSFDYHGVGESEAHLKENINLLDYYQDLEDKKNVEPFYNDAHTAYDYLSVGESYLTVIGYSFGSYLALKYFQKLADQLLVISPPLEKYAPVNNTCKNISCLIAAEDFLDNSAVYKTFDDVTSFACGHFFRGKEKEICQWVSKKLSKPMLESR